MHDTILRNQNSPLIFDKRQRILNISLETSQEWEERGEAYNCQRQSPFKLYQIIKQQQMQYRPTKVN